MTDPVSDPAHILHLAALSTLESTGFISTPASCAGILTDALERYISTLARKSVERAQVNGRNGSSVNVYDVERAIDGFGHGGIEELRDWADQVLMGDRPVLKLGGKGVNSLGDMVHLGLPLIDEQDRTDLYYLPVPEEEPVSPGDESDQDIPMSPSSSASKRKRSASLDEGYESAGSSHSHSWHQQWMPPLPGSLPIISQPEIDQPDALELASLPNPPVPDSNPTVASTDSFNRSQLDSYLYPIAYSSSMLSESHPHSQLSIPKPSTSNRNRTRPSSSFPALLLAYQETANDPSMTLSVKPLRQAAAWFLIQGASNPDSYTPPDTLFASSIATPGPIRSCPVVPVHPVPDPATGSIPPFPLPLLPLDPSPPTIRDIIPHPPPLLSTLVRDLAGQSPFLPRPLRDRLTSLRPPNPLNGTYYGPSVVSHGTTLRATWDSGRADFRDGRLPSGRKVVKEVTGHEGPMGGAGKVTIRLGSGSPLPALSGSELVEDPPASESQPIENPPAPEPLPELSPPSDNPPAVPKPGGLKLKLFARPVASE